MAFKGPMIYHLVDQHGDYGHLRERKRNEGEKRLFEEIMSPNSSNLTKDVNLQFQEFQ